MPIATTHHLPILSWTQVEAQLHALASAAPMRAVASGWLADLRAQAPRLTPDDLLRELLCISWAVMQTQHEHFAASPASPLSPSARVFCFSDYSRSRTEPPISSAG